jgi:hypothetical protein
MVKQMRIILYIYFNVSFFQTTKLIMIVNMYFLN